MLGLSFTRREVLFLAIALLAVIVAAWVVFLQYGARAPSAENVVAQKAAEDLAKSENPFKADNPLESVEANPFSEVKKVLNPFEQ